MIDASWNSRSVGRSAALAAWNDILMRESAPVSVESIGDRFTMDWRRYNVGPIELGCYTCGAVVVHRSRELVRRSTTAGMLLVHARRGAINVVRTAGVSHISEGGFALVDETSEYKLVMPAGGNCLTIRASEAWIAAVIPSFRSSLAGLVSEPGGTSRPLAALLAAMVDHDTVDLGLCRTAMADQIAGLLTVMTHKPLPAGGSCPVELGRQAVRQIEARFSDPCLNPKQIASQIGISRRHLHRVLAQTGVAYSQHLINCRMREAKDLLKKHGTSISIGETAWRCGFADSAHFARVFRAYTGQTPSSFRQHMQ